MNQEHPQELQKAIAFHGHFCPGLAIGYRVAKVAMEKLASGRAEDEELVAIVENDACGIDAIQALLGCTMGKGNLIYRDYGKQVYTIASRTQNKAVRIAMRPNLFPQSPGQEELRASVFSGRATDEERQLFLEQQQERIERLLTADSETLFRIEAAEMPLPHPAKIFKSVTCNFCGEAVMEPRARLREGKIACLACSEEYSRGW